MARVFSDEGNLGLFCGFGGFVDIDLDAPEARALAPHFLPATELMHGRPGKPRSHYWYRVDPPPRSVKFADRCATDGATASLLEVRGLKVDGTVWLQTMVPPSWHPDGDPVRWVAYGPPRPVDGRELLHVARGLAAAALLLRHYPPVGVRHEFVLALARAGWSLDQVCGFVRVIATTIGDEEAQARLADVRSTFERHAAGTPVTGWLRLGQLVDDKVVGRVSEWLGLRPEPRVASAPPPDVDRWPDPLDAAAFHGLVGEFVCAIQPFTEADPVALLLQFLAGFGNVIGRIAYFVADGSTHYLNLFFVLLGITSKGRKGTSLAHIRRLFRAVDESWERDRVQSGLSSGEGLVFFGS